MPFPQEEERERKQLLRANIPASKEASLIADARHALSTPAVNINKQTAAPASATLFVPRPDRPVERNKARRDRVLALLAFVGRHRHSAQPRPRVFQRAIRKRFICAGTPGARSPRPETGGSSSMLMLPRRIFHDEM